jgi:hypothetical protein
VLGGAPDAEAALDGGRAGDAGVLPSFYTNSGRFVLSRPA